MSATGEVGAFLARSHREAQASVTRPAPDRTHDIEAALTYRRRDRLHLFTILTRPPRVPIDRERVEWLFPEAVTLWIRRGP